MRVVIAGCGRVGSELALSLSHAGVDVTVIDTREKALTSLGKGFNGTTVMGVAYDVDVLRSAGIEQADVFVAVTDSDNANLMATEVAKEVFEVPRSIARLYDPAREESYHALGIHHVTGTKLIANVILEQIVEPEFTFHVTFPSGEVEIVEFHVGSLAEGMRVEDLEISGRLRVAAIRRRGETLVPDAHHELHTGDLVVAAARGGVSDKIRAYLAKEDGS